MYIKIRIFVIIRDSEDNNTPQFFIIRDSGYNIKEEPLGYSCIVAIVAPRDTMKQVFKCRPIIGTPNADISAPQHGIREKYILRIEG
jgi:hypothetical protein